MMRRVSLSLVRSTLSSAPRAAKSFSISLLVLLSVPLNLMCWRKWRSPEVSGVSCLVPKDQWKPTLKIREQFRNFENRKLFLRDESGLVLLGADPHAVIKGGEAGGPVDLEGVRDLSSWELAVVYEFFFGELESGVFGDPLGLSGGLLLRDNLS